MWLAFAWTAKYLAVLSAMVTPRNVQPVQKDISILILQLLHASSAITEVQGNCRLI